MHTSDNRKRQHNVKAKNAACTKCRGLKYKIEGTRCEGCGVARDTKFCPGCGGMPERVAGKAGTPCTECGTLAGKNVEYGFTPRKSSSVAWDS